MPGEEQRQHARIETSLECTVLAGESDFSAKVTNLSRGGAGLIAEQGSTQVGSDLMLLIERVEGKFSLSIPARVLRAEPHQHESLYGVHFEAVPPDVDDELVRLLKALAEGKGTGRRESPRISSRVRVKCKSPEAFMATLNDLSRGGLSMRCPRPVPTGSHLSVLFGVEEHPELVAVSGEVLRSALEADGSSMVSMKFDPPTAQDRERVTQLLESLLGLPTGEIIEDDE